MGVFHRIESRCGIGGSDFVTPVTVFACALAAFPARQEWGVAGGGIP